MDLLREKRNSEALTWSNNVASIGYEAFLWAQTALNVCPFGDVEFIGDICNSAGSRG